MPRNSGSLWTIGLALWFGLALFWLARGPGEWINGIAFTLVLSPFVAAFLACYLVRYRAAGSSPLVWFCRAPGAMILVLLAYLLTMLDLLLTIGFAVGASTRLRIGIVGYGIISTSYLQWLRAAAIHRVAVRRNEGRLQRTFG